MTSVERKFVLILLLSLTQFDEVVVERTVYCSNNDNNTIVCV